MATYVPCWITLPLLQASMDSGYHAPPSAWLSIPGLQDGSGLRGVLLTLALDQYDLIDHGAHQRHFGNKLLGRNVAESGIVGLQHLPFHRAHEEIALLTGLGVLTPVIFLGKAVVESREIHIRRLGIAAAVLAAAGSQQAHQHQGRQGHCHPFLHCCVSFLFCVVQVYRRTAEKKVPRYLPVFPRRACFFPPLAFIPDTRYDCNHQFYYSFSSILLLLESGLVFHEIQLPKRLQ